MPDVPTPDSPHPIYLFGKLYNFTIYDCGVALVAANFDGTHRQKNQIVLHTTDGSNTGDGTVRVWNTQASQPPPNRKLASANFIVQLEEDSQAGQLYTNVIQVVDSSQTAWHAHAVNYDSIGIEHTNIGNEWRYARHQETFVAPLHPGDSNPRGGETRLRPQDYNRWYHVKRAGAHVAGDTYATNVSNLDFGTDVMAFDEKQYLSMLLLLRYLCIKHRIPRRFLGDTLPEKMQRWWNFHLTDVDRHGNPLHPDITSPLQQSKLMRFRGILSHINCHWDKICGGPGLHRNRVFRGIIDEWWLPVQFQGNERGYYTGPFDPQVNQASYLRWDSTGPHLELFHDISLSALHETTSYFNFDHLDWYYANGEKIELYGTFPIASNKSWHGGIHLSPPAANNKVFAAASGTIVAARLGGDHDTEADPQWGSQRFVLIRHCVYTQTENNPGGGSRLNYTVNPKYFFTLYMHLAVFPGDIGAPDPQNPPWFNYWLRHRPSPADANAVFCPNVEVSVGDWLGECGTYFGRRMIHFEVVSREELTVAPWDNAAHRIHDASGSMLCTLPQIDRFVQDRLGHGIDTVDILRAARDLRVVKSYHKSEWALANADALKPVLPDPFSAYRQHYWSRLQHFMWVSDALRVCPDLSSQLCDTTGMMWHYHPITFMQFVNQLVAQENGQLSEPDAANTNVSLENGYLKDFVNFAGGVAAPAAADAQPLRPYDVLDQRGRPYSYQNFHRSDIACSGPGAHNPGPTPPTTTLFHVTLLDVLESIHVQFATNIDVVRSHLCAGHSANTPANQALCVLGTLASLQKHTLGLAADIRPAAPSPSTCQSLWNAATLIAGQLRGSCSAHAGEPSRTDLDSAVQAVHDLRVSTSAVLQAKLTHHTALTPAEARSCVLHLELVLATTPARWECWLRLTTRAIAVELDLVGIVGTYSSKADAEAERTTTDTVNHDTTGWRAVINTHCTANTIRLQGGGIVGVYSNFSDAEFEKAAGTVEPWPVEVQPNLN